MSRVEKKLQSLETAFFSFSFLPLEASMLNTLFPPYNLYLITKIFPSFFSPSNGFQCGKMIQRRLHKENRYFIYIYKSLEKHTCTIDCFFSLVCLVFYPVPSSIVLSRMSSSTAIVSWKPSSDRACDFFRNNGGKCPPQTIHWFTLKAQVNHSVLTVQPWIQHCTRDIKWHQE